MYHLKELCNFEFDGSATSLNNWYKVMFATVLQPLLLTGVHKRLGTETD